MQSTSFDEDDDAAERATPEGDPKAMVAPAASLKRALARELPIATITLVAFAAIVFAVDVLLRLLAR